MSEHLDPARSLFLATLPPDDEERRAALAHAESCEACASVLSEGALLLGMLDEAPSGALVEPAVEAQIRRSVLGQASSKVSVWAKLSFWLMFGASLVLAGLDGVLGPGLVPQDGIKCLAMEVMVAVVPFVATGFLAIRGVVAPQPLTLAVTTMAGGLVGQLMLRDMCHAGDGYAHLLAFHVGGVLLSALLGYAGHRALVARFARG